MFKFFEALIKLLTTLCDAIAGNSIGIYCFDVPSSLTAAVAIKISPFFADLSTGAHSPSLISQGKI